MKKVEKSIELYHLMFESTDKEVIMAISMWLNTDISRRQSAKLSKEFNDNFVKILDKEFYNKLFDSKNCKEEL